jgi:hypothetical protein
LVENRIIKNIKPRKGLPFIASQLIKILDDIPIYRGYAAKHFVLFFPAQLPRALARGIIRIKPGFSP